MKFIPILFSTPMVKAILDRTKKQTRRVIKHQPSETGVSAFNDGEHPQMKCPYGKVGDVIWVRETWRKYYNVDENGNTDFDKEIIEYAADNPPMIPEMDGDGFQVFNKDGSEKFISWKPSLFMPKEACRIFLKVKSVRVERLQDIKEQDVKKEGAGQEVRQMWLFGHLQSGRDEIYRRSFQRLWESINGPESWEANPWVWVIEFERVELTEEQKQQFLNSKI